VKEATVPYNPFRLEVRKYRKSIIRHIEMMAM
jgi:hypothetical protein